MKEVEANKLSKECVLTPPVSTGTLRIEIGYREPFGEWFLLSSSLLCLAERTNEAFLPNDLWFYLSSNPEKESESIHERIYQLSNNLINGGSDVAHEKSKHIKG
ncbi:hypothetical protein EV10_1110 [Prochlorococcus marinus str. SS51]|nr:hypothetical protein EV10_1110 [Prochlorococcus marinus str. SS51]